jgi:hypothetical protein
MTVALITSRATKIPDTIIVEEGDAAILTGIDSTGTTEDAADRTITTTIVAEIDGFQEADIIEVVDTGTTEIEDMTEVDLETEAGHTAEHLIDPTNPLEELERVGTRVRKKLTSIQKEEHRLKENSRSDTKVHCRKERTGMIILILIMLR